MRAWLFNLIGAFLLLPSAVLAIPHPPSQMDESVHRKPIEALSDPAERISDAFAVSSLLKRRVKFWFHIYTKYPSTVHVIHDSRYPWIVYEVVNTRRFFAKAKNRWSGHHKAQAYVAKRRRSIRITLARLASRSRFRNLRGQDRRIYNRIKNIRGKKSKVARVARHYVRSQMGQKDFFMNALISSGQYLPHFEKAFKARGLPEELTRIPIVESSFNTKAYSRVGASGVWQLMPNVARKFMIVSPSIDERNNPLKATNTAAVLLRNHYKRFKDWSLAVTAYNHGPGGLRKALRRSKSSTIEQLITRYRRGSFRFASANFYASFLAALHAEKYSQEIFPNLWINKKRPLVHSVVRLDRKYKAQQILDGSGLDKETFLNFNLDLKGSLRKDSSLPKGFQVHLPPDAANTLRKELSIAITEGRQENEETKTL